VPVIEPPLKSLLEKLRAQSTATRGLRKNRFAAALKTVEKMAKKPGEPIQ
jgi:hypothetical protein